jgi:hypothetical protein
MSQPNSKTLRCVYYARRDLYLEGCGRPDGECKFLHSDDENIPIAKPHKILNRAKKEICKFFSSGRCLKGDNCPFKHLILKKDEPCWFFLNAPGGCSKGDDCLYLHSRDQASNVDK